ncbi:MAG: hypothetical protein KAG53_00025 [Endozoicomonadaceae bacterium]|nr:hypothetical protein [Endozoicomonadaceae bacterium]
MLELLQEYTVKHKIEVLAYWLMTNHLHLIFKPSTDVFIVIQCLFLCKDTPACAVAYC